MNVKFLGYLEKSYLDREGGKHFTFEVSLKNALEGARLELMGRDLKNHLPILLEISVRQSDKKQNKAAGSSATIRNARGITGKNRKIF